MERSQKTLPDDLVSQIFQLLPFASIMACKRVCKQWYNLINHPNFSKLYHHNGSMILIHDPIGPRCVLTRQSNEIARFPPYTLHGIPVPFTPIMLELLSGWANGNIVCVKNSDGYFILYNLLSGASHVVRDAPLQLHSRSSWIYYGFGYDRYDDDHKIVLVCDYKAGKNSNVDIKEAQNKENSLFWVYSSRNRTWKSHDGFPYGSYGWLSSADTHGSRCYSFNGVLHSVCSGRRVMLTYDIHTRRFGEISIPEGAGNETKYVEDAITELDGRLCYVYTCMSHGKTKWVMEVLDGAGGCCWTKLLSIDHSGILRSFSYYIGKGYMPLYELRDYTIVGLCEQFGRLLCYDFANNEKVETIRQQSR